MTIISSQILETALSFNEAEIRYHIIDPILRRLGYPGREDVYVKLEEKLEYPFQHTGRRSKKDLPLGFPDYRAGLKGRRGSFVIEAKAGNVDIKKGDVEQAHSYAAHAQVGANFFVLCNGKEFAVFATLSGPESSPIVVLPIAEIDSKFYQLENILSPENLSKLRQVNYDLALSLCDGLGSTAKIIAGEYGMDHWEYRIYVNNIDQTAALKQSLPQLAEYDRQLEMMASDFVLRVEEGVAGRNESGQIFAELKFSGAT